MCFFFFKQKTAYEMRISDWSSDVCSSDLMATRAGRSGPAGDSGQVLWSWRELGGNVSDDTLVSSRRHAHRPPAFERRAMQGHWRSQTILCMGVSTRPNGFEADILMYSTVDQQDLRPISSRLRPARRRDVRLPPFPEERSEEHTSELKSLMRSPYPV